MSEPLMVARGLGKQYGGKGFGKKREVFHAVRNVDLSVNVGETLAIVGESGAGKSTVGRLVLQLVEPDTGTVSFDNTDLLSLPERSLRKIRPQMQMIFQDPFSSLNPTMQIGDSIAEPMKVHGGMTADAVHERVIDLVRRVGLDPVFAERYPRECSGGQLQRVAIARAISTNPKLIVCDEPVTALDLSIRGQILNLLVELQEELGIAYLFISHDLSVVRHFAHRVVVMRSGEVVETGSTEEIFERPCEQYTKDLLAAVPVPSFDRQNSYT